jgi:hypothetical protein
MAGNEVITNSLRALLKTTPTVTALTNGPGADGKVVVSVAVQVKAVGKGSGTVDHRPGVGCMSCQIVSSECAERVQAAVPGERHRHLAQ